VIDQDADELLSAMAGAPTEWDAAMDSQDATLRRRALTDAKIQAMAQQAQAAPPTQQAQPIAQQAPQPSPPRERGFDFERAVAGLTGRGAGIAALDNSRLAAQRQQSDEAIRQQQMQSHQAEQALKQTELRDSVNPQSELSRVAVEEYARTNMARAAILKDQNPKLAAMFEQAAKSSAGKSRMQIMQAEKSNQQMMGELLKMIDFQAKRMQNQESNDIRREGIAASRANAAAMRAIAGDRLAETRNQNAIMNQDRADKRLEREAEAYGKDVAPLNETNELLDEAESVKRNVNTGKISNLVHKGAKFIGVETDKPIDIAGVRVLNSTKDYARLERSIGAVDNQITNLVSGKTITPNEGERLKRELAELDMDDQEFETKVQGIRNRIAIKLKEANKKHPMTSSAKPQAVDRIALAKEALSDPEASPEDKAAAQRILNGGR